MDFLINVGLLTCGFVGALAAFAGETWRESEGPTLKRITKRGWVSLGCLSLALIIGIVKEYRSDSASAEEASKRTKLEQRLRDTGERLQATEQALKAADQKLSNVAPQVSDMAPRVASIPRQVYSLGYGFRPAESRRLEQTLYGGDKIEYDGNCDQLYLIVSGTEYHLRPDRPARIVEGRVGVPMAAVVQNRSRQPCRSKMNILSAEHASR